MTPKPSTPNQSAPNSLAPEPLAPPALAHDPLAVPPLAPHSPPKPLAPHPRRRIDAYGILQDPDGRTLLVSAGPVWRLPGGRVRHGEHPAITVVREAGEQADLVVIVTGVRDVVADVVGDAETGIHHDRLLFELAVRAGTPRAQTTRWVDLEALADLPLAPFTAVALGVPAQPGLGAAIPSANDQAGRQRFAAYGLVTDAAGRILLTRISPGYPGAGRWHLPGGGTDFGESPTRAFLRELFEETGQVGRITSLLTVSHRRNPAAVGPEGRPIDWHSVRVLYRATVDEPTPPTVTELGGGSTAEAAWFAPSELDGLALTEVVGLALAGIREGPHR
jgi:8-oxo-dGTP diphosphatase